MDVWTLITGRTSFIQWMFSKEGLGEQWGSKEAGTDGRALPWHYGHYGYGTVEQQADWLRLAGQRTSVGQSWAL